jgi:hypothetical protein
VSATRDLRSVRERQKRVLLGATSGRYWAIERASDGEPFVAVSSDPTRIPSPSLVQRAKPDSGGAEGRGHWFRVGQDLYVSVSDGLASAPAVLGKVFGLPARSGRPAEAESTDTNATGVEGQAVRALRELAAATKVYARRESGWFWWAQRSPLNPQGSSLFLRERNELSVDGALGRALSVKGTFSTRGREVLLVPAASPPASSEVRSALQRWVRAQRTFSLRGQVHVEGATGGPRPRGRTVTAKDPHAEARQAVHTGNAQLATHLHGRWVWCPRAADGKPAFVLFDLVDARARYARLLGSGAMGLPTGTWTKSPSGVELRLEKQWGPSFVFRPITEHVKRERVFGSAALKVVPASAPGISRK